MASTRNLMSVSLDPISVLGLVFGVLFEEFRVCDPRGYLFSRTFQEGGGMLVSVGGLVR